MAGTAVKPRKKKRKSVTLWFNAAAAVSFAAEANFHVLQPVLPGNVYAWLSFLLILGNTVIRVFFTKEALRPLLGGNQ